MKMRSYLWVVTAILASGWVLYEQTYGRSLVEVELSSDTMPPDEWPLTVERGKLACEANGALVFRAPNGARYAVNEMAQRRFPPIDPIWKIDDRPSVAFTTAVLIAESTRRTIFLNLMACEKEGRAADECARVVAGRFRITTLETRQIGDEGVSLNWPPLAVRRMDLAPLVDRGSRVCR